MRRWVAVCSVVALEGACQGTTTGDDTDDTDGMIADSDTDTDADTDSDTDADTDTDADADTDPGQAVITREGYALVDPGVNYAGVENFVVTGAYGDGDEICVLHTTLTSTASRPDCVDCEWAFDLIRSGSTIVSDVDGACLAVVGVDESTVSTLDGDVLSYGYESKLAGHSPALMVHLGGSWVPATYAEYDEVAQTLTYDWSEGYYPY
jgi:hypothetical protein